MSSFGTFAKNGHRDHSQKLQLRSSVTGLSNQTNSFTPFYTEDFAGGVPAGWLNTDSSGNGVIWKATTTHSFDGTSLSSTGTTAANGYMLFDSDSAHGVGGENADLISSSIDCSGHSTVHLNFNEFLAYYNDTSTVWVSNDGSTWTLVQNSSAGLSQFSSTTNPHNVDVDISAIAANQSTVYIRFNYKADFSFYWMIDDIKLYELPSADASINKIINPANSCTLLSAAEVVTVNVKNSGGTDITGGFDVTYTADAGTPVTEHVTSTILVGDSLAYAFTATADFSTPGTHLISAHVTLSGDTNVANDIISASVFNGPHVVDLSNTYVNGFEANQDQSGWVTEDGNSDNISWKLSSLLPNNGSMCAEITAATADDWFFSTCFDFNAAYLYKLTYYYRTSSTATQADYEVLLGSSQSSGSMTQQLVGLARITNLAYLPSTSNIVVPASGTYYIGWHVMNGDSVASFRLDDIRITVDSASVGISSVEENILSAYPNPSNGIVYLNGGKNSDNYTVEILNTMGQTISSDKTNSINNYEIDFHNQPSGIYLIKLISSKGISVKQVSITH